MIRGVLMVITVIALAATALPAQAAEIQGTVQSISPSGDTLKLADGTTLLLPQSLQVERGQLMPGAQVKASYQEQNGQKVVTNIVVTPGREKRQ